MHEAGFFEPDGDALMPIPDARGPWAEDMMHGRLLAGLAAWAIDRDHGDPAFVPARLTVDLFKSPGMKESRVMTSLVRRRRTSPRLVDAFVQVGGVDVARGTALYLRKGEAPVDDAPLTATWDSTIPEHEDNPFDMPFEVRPVDGMGFGAVGPRRTWLRELRPLVTGEPLTPFIRAAVVADFASPRRTRRAKGSSTSTPTSRSTSLGFPKASGSVSSTPTAVTADGVSVAHCRLHDETGPIGSSEVCAVRNPRMPRFEEPQT